LRGPHGAAGLDQSAYAQRTAAMLIERGYRDCRAQRLARKIVDAHERGSPVLLAPGRREAAGSWRCAGATAACKAALAALAEAPRGEAFR
jgi:hypothetical protein